MEKSLSSYLYKTNDKLILRTRPSETNKENNNNSKNEHNIDIPSEYISHDNNKNENRYRNLLEESKDILSIIIQKTKNIPLPLAMERYCTLDNMFMDNLLNTVNNDMKNILKDIKNGISQKEITPLYINDMLKDVFILIEWIKDVTLYHSNFIRSIQKKYEIIISLDHYKSIILYSIKDILTEIEKYLGLAENTIIANLFKHTIINHKTLVNDIKNGKINIKNILSDKYPIYLQKIINNVTIYDQIFHSITKFLNNELIRKDITYYDVYVLKGIIYKQWNEFILWMLSYIHKGNLEFHKVAIERYTGKVINIFSYLNFPFYDHKIKILDQNEENQSFFTNINTKNKMEKNNSYNNTFFMKLYNKRKRSENSEDQLLQSRKKIKNKEEIQNDQMVTHESIIIDNEVNYSTDELECCKILSLLAKS